VVALDHTSCFVEEDLETGLEGPHFVDDERIYGLFPEFISYLDEASLRRAAGAVLRIDADTISEIVHSVPHEWGPTRQVRDRWAARIFERGEKVAERTVGRLVRQMQMGF
jgi:hypothetical protein